MGLWRIWHPTYGVIYDEGEVIKRGTYTSSVRSLWVAPDPAVKGERVRPQGALCKDGKPIPSLGWSHLYPGGMAGLRMRIPRQRCPLNHGVLGPQSLVAGGAYARRA